MAAALALKGVRGFLEEMVLRSLLVAMANLIPLASGGQIEMAV